MTLAAPAVETPPAPCPEWDNDLPHPAWIEIDLAALRRNFALIRRDGAGGPGIISVVKDDAYGHGLLPVARVALESGATALAVSTLGEARRLREAGITAPVLMLGERLPEELPACLDWDVTLTVGRAEIVRELDRLSRARRRRTPVHLKVDTGMNRHGVRWDAAVALARDIAQRPGLRLAGVMSHFAMSDEADASFAHLQRRRFAGVLDGLAAAGIAPGWRHLCNSGGLLQLPEAHYDFVRIGILPLGVYPSAVCRRLPGTRAVMSVKARLVSVRELRAGETYGYGLRYRAESRRRIGVIPLGYGDGLPRMVNRGRALVGGREAPLIGSVAMDATAVDVTDVPEARPGDEVVILGRQGEAEITARDLAAWAGTVCYDVLTCWNWRVPRIYREDSTPS